MSGTSLDGLDLVYVLFYLEDGAWRYQIVKAETVAYPVRWQSQLANAHTLNAEALIALDRAYGTYIGEQVRLFVNGLQKPDFVASHGHTIMHRPELGYTLQIGHGANLAQAAGLPVVADFRSADVAAGGQGAPLVPAGEQILFQEHHAFVNLGGFANASLVSDKGIIAFDIVPCNIVLNALCTRLNLQYDAGGRIAASGKSIPQLLDKLNALPYYRLNPPKSLGREWVSAYITPLLEQYASDPIPDLLHTFCLHVAEQVHLAVAAKIDSDDTILFSGGGVFNAFLMQAIRQCGLGKAIAVPDEQTICFKEALVFAFLGLLFFNDIPNCLPSVTGASRPVIGGALYKY